MTGKMKSFILLAALASVQLLNVSDVAACTVNQSGPMPKCGGLQISDDTDIIVLESHDTGGLTNVLMGPDEHSAEYVNIIIGDVPRPVTIVVSHYNAAILNFSGNVDRVDQVIAMGARRLGWDHVATAGIAIEKVRFLPVVGHDQTQVTSCSSAPKSCVPEQYFALTDFDRSWFGDMPVDATVIRLTPTTYIRGLRESSIVIPSGESLGVETETATVVEAREFSWPQNWQDEVDAYNSSTNDLLTFAADDLISPTTLSLNADLPSWAGMAGLIEQGVIRPAGDYQTDRALIQFSEHFNARYRTRFDPDFRFEPRIDFVIERQFRDAIPRDLRRVDGGYVTFLRNGRLVPERNAGDTGRYCFFSQSDQLAQPSPRGSTDRTQWLSQCRAHSLGGTRGLSSSPLAAMQLEAATELEGLREWITRPRPLPLQALQFCRLFDVPADAEVVVLSTQDGRVGSSIGFKHCGIETSTRSVSSGTPGEILGVGSEQCEAGEIDVRIERDGPVFLFLKGRGALQWNFDISEDSEIVGVVTVNNRRQTASGLPQGVSFNQYTTGDRSLPDGCRNRLMNASPVAGGPAIQLFEMMLDRTIGREIDLLLNKGVSPDTESQTPDRVRDYTSFLVR